MAISRNQVRPERLPRAAPPIKYLTENGFSIIRGSDHEHSIRDSPANCRFLIQRGDTQPHEVDVSFSRELVVELRFRRRTPLSDDSMFWLVCAESCLANYLWQNGDLPPKAHLLINELSP